MKKHKYLVTISYDGLSYKGLVKQPEKLTIIDHLENGYFRTFKEKITIIPAGRTDAGVHALNQKISFESHISIDKIVPYWNRSINNDIKILDCLLITDKDFHVRFSVLNKVYTYKLIDLQKTDPFNHRYYTSINRKKVNMKMFQKSLNLFLGINDYTSVSTKEENVDSNREIKTIRTAIKKNNSFEYLEVTFEGQSFIRHMIRRIVGSSLAVSMDEITFSELEHAFKNKIKLKYKAESNGLYLKRIDY